MAGEVTTALLLLALMAAVVVASGSEGDALLGFRATLRGPNGGPPAPLNGWVTTPGPCSGGNSLWYGVRCSEATGRVLVLELEYLGLQGPAPNLSVLAALPGLRSLSLANNNLTRAFPDVSALPGLRMLYLHGNRLAGRIPDDALAPLRRGLQKLYLSGNAFTGPIPSSVTLSPRLLELQLSNNGFEGALPDFGQTDLKLVDFSNNNLSGQIPPALRRFDANAFRGDSVMHGQQRTLRPTTQCFVSHGACTTLPTAGSTAIAMTG
ncbi:hypothetical protein EJB05_41850, partial [Eragrostis curvula]